MLGLMAIFLAGPVTAGEALTAEQVKALFTNKTFDVHNVAKDKNLQVHDADGGNHYVYIPWKDKTKQREWWIEGNKHCTSHPKRGNACKVVLDMGDGTYKGMTDGEHTHTLSNFRDGNQLP